MGEHHFIACLRALTARTIAQRFELENRRMNVALELKGLKGKAVKAAANMERLNLAYDKFNELAPEHAADVEGLAPQIAGMADDLTFAAQTLGNSVNGSGDGVKKPEIPLTPLDGGSLASTEPATH